MKINRPKHIDSMTDFEKKHTPSVEIIAGKVIVKVGSGITHPMNPEHLITNIELLVDGNIAAEKELDDEDEPAATFELDERTVETSKIMARATCNLHGTWESAIVG
ncbi:MAG: hypothetical protein GXO64_04495 [Candidatus Micrarchaeota archaeon]|nr:hypothetical protein [Candidatus Micrarchaeota archaeon]